MGIKEKQIYQNFVQDELLLVNSKKMYELAGISKAIDKSVLCFDYSMHPPLAVRHRGAGSVEWTPCVSN